MNSIFLFISIKSKRSNEKFSMDENHEEEIVGATINGGKVAKFIADEKLYFER